MDNVVVLYPRHGRASSSFRSAKVAKTFKLIPRLPRSAAKATTEAQCGAGMPRFFQPLTVPGVKSKASATSPSDPGVSPQSVLMTDSQLSMESPIVRTLRTRQGFATRETTFRGLHGEISTMDSDDDIARRLIAVREHFTLSQVDFAGKLHIAKNTLNGFEKAKRPLTIETAKRIRDRFGVSTDWLLYGDVGQPSHDLAVSLGPVPDVKKDAETPKRGKKRRKAS
jgi:transcriptional regulator with XRE-family HTH domain